MVADMRLGRLLSGYDLRRHSDGGTLGEILDRR